MSKLYRFDTKTFPFDELSLANPNGVQGGAYISKLRLSSNKFLIQTPNTITKKGVVKTDKKMYCDLMFDRDDAKIQEFIDTLENKVKELIYTKKDIWFHTEMDMDTIDYHWQSSLRSYQGDKNLLRCYIKKPKNTINQSSPSIQIYDEDETELTLDSITKDKTIISVLSIDGLKFTPQSFSLGFAIEQIMVLNDDYKKNNKCLIKIDNTNETSTQDVSEIKNTEPAALLPTEEVIGKNEPSTSIDEGVNAGVNAGDEENSIKQNLPTINEPVEIETTPINIEPESNNKEEPTTNDIINEQHTPILKTNNNPTSLTLKDLAISNDTNNDELDKKEQTLEDSSVLHEAEIKIPEKDETSVSLKKPNEVYLEIYSEVKRRAKEAKMRALAAQLEVKRVKALYMLDDIDSSSDEDFSESSDSEDAELSN
jgi:hypothetical protein